MIRIVLDIITCDADQYDVLDKWLIDNADNVPDGSTKYTIMHINEINRKEHVIEFKHEEEATIFKLKFPYAILGIYYH